MEHDKKSAGQADHEADAKDLKAQAPKIKKELSVVSLPHDNDVMAQEMADLFNEDRVTHKHGGSEPEKD
jgi:hypothetical protein